MVIYTCPKCGKDLIPVVYTTLPPISAYVCTHCGWKHEDPREDINAIKRVPFPINKEGL